MSRQPIRKFRCRKTRRLTSGLSCVNSRTRNSDEADHQQQRRPADPVGAEPVVFLAFVEDDLQRAQPDGQQPKADAVDPARLGVLDVRRVFDEPRDHQDRDDADGNVDVERPAPRVGVGQVAAQRRSQHRGHDHAQCEDRHRAAALLGRETFQQNRLRQRLQRASAGALNGARDQDDRAGSLAAPQAKDDAVKITMQVMRKRLRPNLRENQVLAGSTMALATR